jgi:hypothetical protein
MPRVGFEPKILLFDRATTFYAVNRPTAEIGVCTSAPAYVYFAVHLTKLSETHNIQHQVIG